MKDITFIVLTKNEGKNIEACISSAKTLAKRIIVVDSGSNDKTVEIAQQCGAETVFHEWCGHANQFNWALENCNIKTEWVFRLDADERVSKELAEEIISLNDENGVNGYSMRWRVYFMDKWIKHGGTHKPYFLRLFRYEKGRVENKIMDEHIIVEGEVKKLSNDLIHYDYKGLDAWVNKHVWYSNLEIETYNKRAINNKRGFYYKLPLFLRAKLYYWYRYYLQLGFLDGREGKILIYLQAYWYRFLVDAKIYEQKRKKKINEKDTNLNG